MLPQWLDLAFADRERIEAVVNEALALQPNIGANEFRRFVEGRARAIQGIAALLCPFMEGYLRDSTLKSKGYMVATWLPI
jgi:hypothetical protein